MSIVLLQLWLVVQFQHLSNKLPSVPDSVQLQLDVATTSVILVSSSRAADCENANTGPAMSDANPVDCTSVTQTDMRVGMFYGSRCRRATVKPSKYC